MTQTAMSPQALSGCSAGWRPDGHFARARRRADRENAVVVNWPGASLVQIHTSVIEPVGMPSGRIGLRVWNRNYVTVRWIRPMYTMRLISTIRPVIFAVSLTSASALLFSCTSQRANAGRGDAARGAAHPDVISAVDHVGLTVTDLEASKDLFVQVLGFHVRNQDKDYPAYFLTNGATTITLWRAEDPSTAIAFDRRKNVGLHHVALRVPSFEVLEAVYERLRVYPGVTIEFAPELAYGGPARHMIFREPSGNRIELVHRPNSAP